MIRKLFAWICAVGMLLTPISGDWTAFLVLYFGGGLLLEFGPRYGLLR